MNNDLKVYYDGDSSYAARDVAHATELWEKDNGCEWGEEHNEAPEAVWVERPLDEKTSVTFDYTNDMLKAAPDGADIYQQEGTSGGKVTATWRAWAIKTGPGLICSENW